MNRIDRYKILVRYAIDNGIAPSQKELGKMLGYSNESSFSQILNEKVGRPKDFITKLQALIPGLNENWFDYGGEMIIEQSEEISFEEKLKVPLLPISAQAGSLNDFTMSVSMRDCEMIVSPIKGADYAMRVAGESMSPEYPNGSQVLIKRVNEKMFLQWGSVYVLDTYNGVVMKQIVQGSKPDRLKCLSLNSDPKYAPFEVKYEDIIGFYRVLMCMSLK